MRVAIAHDWLTGMRGGEKCLEVFCELFPEATLFTLVHDKGSVSPTIEKMNINTSFLQKVPGIAKNYRSFLPFFPMAIESFDLAGYDLVLSSSHAVAKGIKSPPGALHISYCYTPMRYAWQFFDDYFSGENAIKKMLIRTVINRLKKWDLASNKRIDYFVAISDNVKGRIRRFYGRDADVIYPPCDIGPDGTGNSSGEGFYLVVSALVPYKRVDLAVKAFSGTKKRLVVVGMGSELESLKKTAASNVEFIGWAGDMELDGYYRRCTALIFPGEEDFGIVPVEAQARGKAVIAYAAGGALETVRPFGESKPTGVFFKEQTVQSLSQAIKIFEDNRSAFDPAVIRKNAVRFNRERFKNEIKEYVREKLIQP